MIVFGNAINRLTGHMHVAGVTLQLNLVTLGAVLLLVAHLAVDIQTGNWSAVIADIAGICAALGLPSIFPIPTPPPPPPVPPIPTNH